MTPDSFKRTTREPAPPNQLSPALQGLWWAAKGDWNRAHVLVQDDPSREAGRPEASDPLEVEWGAIAAALLPATTSTRTGRGAE